MASSRTLAEFAFLGRAQMGEKSTMKLYKLTDENGQTKNATQWGEGVEHAATGDAAQDLCSDGWIHAYESPLLAVLLNPIHANFRNPILWEAEGEVEKRDGQLKVGCRKLRTLQKIPLPKIKTEQRVKFAVFCAQAVYDDAVWHTWAKNWLSGKDRSAGAAAEAARAAEAWAAENATRITHKKIDLIALAEKAVS